MPAGIDETFTGEQPDKDARCVNRGEQLRIYRQPPRREPRGVSELA